MNPKFKSRLFAVLLGTAATVSPAVAQENAGNADGNCVALRSLTEENRDRLNAEWRGSAEEVARSANEAECRTYVEEATAALNGEGDSAEAVEARGRIVVTQPDPSVTVEQGQPEVTVRQAPSRVTVNQGEPQIIVRQAQPTIRVDIPRPVITIDQPQPEIIVRMPEPQVGVQTPEPEIEVRMPQPEVSVSQSEPQVQVQMAETEGTDDEANVQIERGQAIIRRAEQAEEPQIEVQRGEPQVSYESAEPNVQFSQPEEPEIRYSQSGEPNIRIERAEGQQAGAEGGAEQQQEQSAESGAQDDIAARLLADGNTAGQQTGELRAYAVDDVIGTTVTGVQGRQLGTVERLVTNGERNFAVLGGNGAVSLEGQDLVIPLDVMVVENGSLALRGLSQEDFSALQSGSLARQVQPIGRDYSVEIATR